ncbi:VC0807 family protein [Amycolatopsis pigmentata]|uniref:VC0807 family protein n=1 Tax=Amycolatopsis pigmentata TaxID=450801 RepID=A0ABW5FXT8_9PSEU
MVSRVLLIHVLIPLALFYGLRGLGVNPFAALLAGGAIPAASAVRDIVVDHRVSGVRVFVLGAMVLTVAISFVTGSPRVLLIRNAWGTAALGVFLLASLLTRRPFLFEAGNIVFDENKRRIWARNWENFPAFRSLLLRCSAIWGLASLADAGVRVAMAMTLPVDVVPVLDDVLLVLTLAFLVAVQRFYGRAHLRRNGLRLNGVEILPLAESR